MKEFVIPLIQWCDIWSNAKSLYCFSPSQLRTSKIKVNKLIYTTWFSREGRKGDAVKEVRVWPKSSLEAGGGVDYVDNEDGGGRRRIGSSDSFESFSQFGRVTTCYDEGFEIA